MGTEERGKSHSDLNVCCASKSQGCSGWFLPRGSFLIACQLLHKAAAHAADPFNCFSFVQYFISVSNPYCQHLADPLSRKQAFVCMCVHTRVHVCECVCAHVCVLSCLRLLVLTCVQVVGLVSSKKGHLFP